MSEAYDPTTDDELRAVLADNAENAVEPGLGEGVFFERVYKEPVFGRSSQKKTLFVRFDTEVFEAGEGVNEDLAEQVAAGGKKSSHTFYLSPNALFMLNGFFKACGVAYEGMERGEAIQACVGQTFGAYYEEEAQPSDPDRPNQQRRPRYRATNYFPAD